MFGVGGSKKQEYYRSCDLFDKILLEQDSYFALAFLVDSGYGKEDLKAMVDIKLEQLKLKYQINKTKKGG